MESIRQNELAQPPRSLLSQLNRRNWNIGLKLIYISLQLVDLGLTILAAGSGYNELNPFIRGLLDAPLQLFVVKMVIPVLIALLVPGKYLIPGVLMLSLIVGWNIKELISLVL